MPDQDPLELRVLARFLLTKYNDRMQAITEFCERTHMQSDQAEALIGRVEAAMRQEVEQASMPSPETVTTRSRFLVIVIILAAVLLMGIAMLVVFLVR